MGRAPDWVGPLRGRFEAGRKVNATGQCKACGKGPAEEPRLILYDGYCYDCLVDRIADAIERGALRKAWQEGPQMWLRPREVSHGQ